VESVQREFANEIPAHWSQVADNPRRWMSRFADAVVDSTAQVLQPLIERSKPLIDREIERIGRAAVHDGIDVLLNNLGPRLSVTNGLLQFFDVEPGRYELGNRSLVLVPLVAGDRLLMSNVDCPDIVWIGYPMPGSGQLWERPAAIRRTDPLELLVGVPRAMILRFLTRRSTMGEVAESLQFAPNTITFHCKHLERTGLITRERRGQQVRVRRTERAEKLIDLMS
jgi:DNA-binding transcriptional ArsR family regulator